MRSESGVLARSRVAPPELKRHFRGGYAPRIMRACPPELDPPYLASLLNPRSPQIYTEGHRQAQVTKTSHLQPSYNLRSLNIPSPPHLRNYGSSSGSASGSPSGSNSGSAPGSTSGSPSGSLSGSDPSGSGSRSGGLVSGCWVVQVQLLALTLARTSPTPSCKFPRRRRRS